MNIEIFTKNHQDINYKFGQWLLEIIESTIKTSIDEKKLIPWNEYMNTDGVLEFVGRKSILAKEIILSGANNLKVIELPNKLIIGINKLAKVNGVQNLKLETACKLINYGNTSIKGYPIFSDTFQQITSNIDVYVELYLMQSAEGTQ